MSLNKNNNGNYSPPIYELGENFYDPVNAANFPEAKLRFKNSSAINLLGLSDLDENHFKKHFWQFLPLPNNISHPLALRYHGHQFGSYNPDLGDGRGFLFAQFFKDNKLFDLGTKGSGQTPYSRRGDGRLTLKGAFREALATELLESLGVNTSKTFSIFETGESLERNDEPSPTRAAVLVRMSHGHIRIGTFQRLHFLQQKENIKKLTAYCIKYYYPEIHLDITSELTAKTANSFFLKVIERNADLVASIMMAGFVHGVLNSDNINVSGELFDFGPYRFLPKYDPHFTAAYFDQSGFYCFGRQPMSFAWNLEQLGQALQFAFSDLNVEIAMESFEKHFNQSLLKYFFNRLNLNSKNSEQDLDLLKSFFHFLSPGAYSSPTQPFFEQTFFDLYGGVQENRIKKSPQVELYESEKFQDLKNRIKNYSVANQNKLQHSYFNNQKPQTLLIEEIENLWKTIDEKDDWSSFDEKINSIRSFRGLY